MNTREAILNGVRRAAELHYELGIRDTLKNGKEPIDVFGAIFNLDLALLCRPLEGLLGAYTSKFGQGILVTTRRRLPIQRFTAAHELGHFALGHEESLDSEETIELARQGVVECPLQEIEAEAFAAEFLLPKWLVVAIAKRQGWGKSDFSKPDIVYQLSLRAGVSYEATWRMLAGNRWIDQATVTHLRSTPPKESKKHVLRRIVAADPWADAYALTEGDAGSYVYASPEDTVTIDLCEHSAAGYIWSIQDGPTELELISDERQELDHVHIGGEVHRKIAVRGTSRVNLRLAERRPWEAESPPLKTFDVTIDFEGKEEGLPRAARQ